MFTRSAHHTGGETGLQRLLKSVDMEAGEKNAELVHTKELLRI